MLAICFELQSWLGLGLHIPLLVVPRWHLELVVALLFSYRGCSVF